MSTPALPLTGDASNPSPGPFKNHPIVNELIGLIPSIQRGLAGIAAAAGNPELQNQLNFQDELDLRRRGLSQQRDLLQSQLQNQSLQRQREQLEINNYQTP